MLLCNVRPVVYKSRAHHAQVVSMSEQQSTLNGVRIVTSAPSNTHTDRLKGVTVKTSAPAFAGVDGQAVQGVTVQKSAPVDAGQPAHKKM